MELPVICQKAPYKVTLEAGKKYSFCTCGLSETQPFCDGKHKETGFKSLKIFPEETKEYYLCGCKHAKGGQAFCDGSHNSI